MKPNKRLAAVAAAAMAMAGFAVVAAPNAQAYTGSQSLNCKTLTTTNGAGGPWVTNHTFTVVQGADTDNNYLTNAASTLSLSFTIGPPTGPVALVNTQLVPRAVVALSGPGAPAAPNNLVTLSGPAYGPIGTYTPIPTATLTASLPAGTLGVGAVTGTVEYYVFDDTITDVETICNTAANPAGATGTTTPVWTSAAVNNVNSGPTTIVEATTYSAPPATITAPAAAGVNSVIQVTGSNFPASTAYTVEFLNASNASVGTPATGTTTAAGSILANLSVVAGATQISVTAGAQNITQAFTASADECAGPCSLTQDLVLGVLPGTFKQKAVTKVCAPVAVATCNAVNSGPLQINFGTVQTAPTSTVLGAALNTTQVTDSRGVDSGWTLTAQMPTALTTPAGSSIKQPNMVLTSAACDKIDNVDPDGTPPFGGPGTDSSANISCGAANQSFGSYGAGGVVVVGTVTLAQRTPGAGTPPLGYFGSGGGYYSVDGNLAVTVNAFQATGNYTGTMVITLA